MISFPVPNRVFQQVNGVASFVPLRRGSGTWRLKKDGVIVAENSDGRFVNVPVGWYDLVLMDGVVEADSIKIGVGDVYVVAGQSNAVSPRQPLTHPLPTPASGKVILSDKYGKGFDSFIDAGVTEPVTGVAWLFAGIALNRPYPVMFVNVAAGNTSCWDWANVLGERLFRAWAVYQPRAILWHQGESECTSPPRTDSYAMMDALILSLRQVTTTPWVMAYNSTSYPGPGGGHWPIRGAQDQIIVRWSHVYEGPDTDRIRVPGEVEFLGDSMRQHGELWATRLIQLGL
jgi:hypothetical protein